MDYSEAKKKMLAAQELMLEPWTNSSKFGAIKTLLQGIHPRLDEMLERVGREVSSVEKLIHGEVIELSAEQLPEHTEEEKKRKRLLLLFIKTWKGLKSEVARVQKELEAAENANTPGAKRSHWARVADFAKGPFGIITIAAVVIALGLQATAVRVRIENEGCSTIPPPTTFNITLPGLSLSKEPIPDGETGMAKLPPLPVSVDATVPGTMSVRSLSLNYVYDLPSTTRDIKLNDVSLIGKKTDIRLWDRREHSLTIVCGVR